MKEILSTMQANHYMNLVIIIVALVALLIAWNIQRDKNNQIDLKDLVCKDGRINEAKFMRFCTFVVSTWGFVYLIVDQRFSEWYFAGYMAAWTGNALVNKWLSIKEQNTAYPAEPPPPPAKPQS
jgi:small-conductance mechanosensitive channel